MGGIVRAVHAGGDPGAVHQQKELVAVPLGYMLSGGGTLSDWVRNLTRTPGVRVHVGADEYIGTARIVTAPQEDRLARDAVHDKYAARFFGDLTPWRENALPIAVDLDPTGTG